MNTRQYVTNYLRQIIDEPWMTLKEQQPDGKLPIMAMVSLVTNRDGTFTTTCTKQNQKVVAGD